ncbi:H-NS histone family protein [Pseudothauera rhizosphaerae]|uniref:H-NS histone family protein n=2 Tax=Pseudothauera rhizosphaerae TaxID=2565932 RepID=A0A4S4B164_9RHOO|nr:H-NS histone family protein [Pseudothauera rhizosphaerae]THF65384.1 H-NS histone family protein [Pseudothauera rhizosphaerae]
MPTYVEIMAQIEALQKQAEAIREAEITSVIAEIRQKIRDYELTAADLGFGAIGPAKEERIKQPTTRASVKPKYRDPVSGKTWPCRGMMPKWMKAALEAGHTREEFLIPET